MGVASALALAVSGCASLDPTGLLYDDETPAPEQVSAGGGEEAEAFPDLSSVPERPSRSPSRQAERRRVLDQLAADRANAAYSDEPLRGDGNGGAGESAEAGHDAGTTGAGEVPPAAEVPEMPPAPSEAAADEAPEAAAAPPDDSAAAPSQPAQDDSAAQGDGADQADAMASPAESPREPPAEETAGRERMKAGEAASGQASGTTAGGQQAAATTNGSAGRDAARGSRATRTAAQSAQSPANGATAGDGVDRSNIPQIEPSRQGEPVRLPGEARMAGDGAAPSPDARTTTQTAQATPPRVQVPGADQPAVRTPPPANGAGERVAVIYFGHGSTGLNGQDRQVLRQVARIQQQRGGRLRVVGHASHRTATMSPVQHRIVNLDVSMARAEQVADALASFGVPRENIQVEARADSEPVYFEYMPTGEAGNRRAEVYLVR